MKFIFQNPEKKAAGQSSDKSDNEKILQNSNTSRKKSRIPKTLGLCLLLCLIGLGLFWLVCRMLLDVSMMSMIRGKCGVRDQDMDYKIESFDQHQQSFTPKIPSLEQCVIVPQEMRFDCYPEDGATEQFCAARGCCWTPSWNYGEEDERKSGRVPLDVPYCYYPENWRLYEFTKMNNSEAGFEGELKNIGSSIYKRDIPVVKMEAVGSGKNILRVKMFDANEKRYEPLWPIIEEPREESKNSDYVFKTMDFKPGFRVTRQSTNVDVFDSFTPNDFIFADQFLQMSTLLPSDNIYGLGEHRGPLKLNTNWQSFTLFNKDGQPTENANLYGSHPFYMVLEPSGHWHGVLFLNSNAMDVILQPTPALTFRSIGGIFDMFFFMGPTVDDVLMQYARIIGKPFMPPYWSLGFHLCRFGYGSLEKTREVWNRTRKAGIPFDTQWNDLDYMENNNDFTYNKNNFKGLPDFVKELHGADMHYIPLIDPGVSASEKSGTYPPYDEGMRQDIFIKDGDKDGPFVGKVWNKVSTVWPDFTHPKVLNYWYSMMNNMHQEFEYDGAWIDMNEIANFYDGHDYGCSNNILDNPPYHPNVVGGKLATKTLCMNARHAAGPHYNVHNTYAVGEAVATYKALAQIRQKRPFVLSRASWVGLGKYSAHWTGDIHSNWYDLKMSIPEILRFSFFQIPMVGADICGFAGNTTAELCSRWMQVGAFYPFSRNHNSDDAIEQDPVALGDLVVASSKKALEIRYRLLPYLYSLFYKAYKYGAPVLRPLFFSYSQDKNTLDIDTQFMWGESLMIVPVLEEGKTQVKAYLPEGTWHDYHNYKIIESPGKWFIIDAPLDTIPLFLRAGSIIPAQVPSPTAVNSRQNVFELIITLPASSKENSTGFLYWDDGESLEVDENKRCLYTTFVVLNGNRLTNEIHKLCKPELLKDPIILGRIEVRGVRENVKEVIVNGKSGSNFSYNRSLSFLDVYGMNSKVYLTEKLEVTWQ